MKCEIYEQGIARETYCFGKNTLSCPDKNCGYNFKYPFELEGNTAYICEKGEEIINHYRKLEKISNSEPESQLSL